MKTLTVAVDYSKHNEDVLTFAADLAIKLGCGLDLVHILEPEPALVGMDLYVYPGVYDQTSGLEEEKKLLAEMTDSVREKGIECNAYMQPGDAVSGIISFAQKHEASMIVLGSHTHGLLDRVLLGSVSSGVVKKSEIPVLVVPRTKE